MGDWRGTTSYAYDQLSRVTSITTPDGKSVAYSYDAAGDRVSFSYPDGRVAQYSHDALNRLSKATDWASKATNYRYDSAGDLTDFTHPNSAASTYHTNMTLRIGWQVSLIVWVQAPCRRLLIHRQDRQSTTKGNERRGREPIRLRRSIPPDFLDCPIWPSHAVDIMMPPATARAWSPLPAPRIIRTI
jgi:YD repeat-containing protein